MFIRTVSSQGNEFLSTENIRAGSTKHFSVTGNSTGEVLVLFSTNKSLTKERNKLNLLVDLFSNMKSKYISQTEFVLLSSYPCHNELKAEKKFYLYTLRGRRGPESRQPKAPVH